MALANEVLQGRFNAVLHKLLSMKEGAPSPQLSPEIMPVIGLEMDRPEWAFLGGSRLGFGVATAAAAVGKRSAVGVYNVSTSNVLIVVEYVLMWGTGVNPLFLNTTFVSGSVSNPCYSRDTRDRAQLAGAIFSNNTLTAAQLSGTQIGIGTPRIAGLGGYDYSDFREPVLLGPGGNLTCEQGGDNQTQVAMFVIRERTLEPSETR